MQDDLFFPIRQEGGESAMTIQGESKNRDNEMDNLLAKIDSITKHQKPYIVNSLKRMAEKNSGTVNVLFRSLLLLIFIEVYTHVFVSLPQFFYRHHLSIKTANPWLFKEMRIKVTEELQRKLACTLMISQIMLCKSL